MKNPSGSSGRGVFNGGHFKIPECIWTDQKIQAVAYINTCGEAGEGAPNIRSREVCYRIE